MEAFVEPASMTTAPSVMKSRTLGNKPVSAFTGIAMTTRSDITTASSSEFNESTSPSSTARLPLSASASTPYRTEAIPAARRSIAMDPPINPNPMMVVFIS
jgi:hypothetical protein